MEFWWRRRKNFFFAIYIGQTGWRQLDLIDSALKCVKNYVGQVSDLWLMRSLQRIGTSFITAPCMSLSVPLMASVIFVYNFPTLTLLIDLRERLILKTLEIQNNFKCSRSRFYLKSLAIYYKGAEIYTGWFYNYHNTCPIY